MEQEKISTSSGCLSSDKVINYWLKRWQQYVIIGAGCCVKMDPWKGCLELKVRDYYRHAPYTRLIIPVPSFEMSLMDIQDNNQRLWTLSLTKWLKWKCSSVNFLRLLRNYKARQTGWTIALIILRIICKHHLVTCSQAVSDGHGRLKKESRLQKGSRKWEWMGWQYLKGPGGFLITGYVLSHSNPSPGQLSPEDCLN